MSRPTHGWRCGLDRSQSPRPRAARGRPRPDRHHHGARMTLRQRQPRERVPAFLAFVRTKQCCVCRASPPSEAAHIRMACAAYDKRETGKGEKPNDRWAVPLCIHCHRNRPNNLGLGALHNVGERKFWKRRLHLDPFKIASELWWQFVSLHQPPPPRPRHRRKLRVPKRTRKIPSRPFPKGRKFPTRRK